MKIVINGKEVIVDSTSLKNIIEKYINNEYDVIIYNGYPIDSSIDIEVKENDNIFFIKKGKTPSYEELEYLMISRHTPGVYKKLRAASIGIAGVGGLGSNVAVALARMGVGKLILADFDIVEPSNLNRQQYFIKDLGRPKVEALKETLAMINPYVDVQAHYLKIDQFNAKIIFKEAYIVIECFDKAEEKAMIIKTLAAEKIVIAASGIAGYGDNDSIITRKINDKLYIIGDFENEADIGMGLMAPRVMIAAAKQANLAVELVLEFFEGNS